MIAHCGLPLFPLLCWTGPVEAKPLPIQAHPSLSLKGPKLQPHVLTIPLPKQAKTSTYCSLPADIIVTAQPNLSRVGSDTIMDRTQPPTHPTVPGTFSWNIN